MCAKEIAVGVYASAAAHVVSTVVYGSILYVGLYVIQSRIQYTHSQWISWVCMVSIIMISSTI